MTLHPVWMPDLQLQDQKIDQILDGVTRLKYMSRDINQELDLHGALLEDLENAVDNTDAKMVRNTKRIEEVADKEGSGWCGICTMLILLIFIVILAVSNTFCVIFRPSRCG